MITCLDDILGLILVQLEHVGDGAQPWLIIDDVFNVYCRLVLMVGASYTNQCTNKDMISLDERTRVDQRHAADAAPCRVDSCAESNHLHRVALLPTTRALDMVHLTLVVHVSEGSGCVVHRAEVVEETTQGIQGLQVVARFYL